MIWRSRRKERIRLSLTSLESRVSSCSRCACHRSMTPNSLCFEASDRGRFGVAANSSGKIAEEIRSVNVIIQSLNVADMSLVEVWEESVFETFGSGLWMGIIKTDSGRAQVICHPPGANFLACQSQTLPCHLKASIFISDSSPSTRSSSFRATASIIL